MKAKILSLFLFISTLVSLHAINIATPVSNGDWNEVAWKNLRMGSSYPDDLDNVYYDINLNKDLTLAVSVKIDGLNVSKNNLSFSILDGGCLSIEKRINVNNHNFSINLLSGGKLYCKDFEGFNAYEGREFNINFFGGEFHCEGEKSWLRNSMRISWNFGGVYNEKFYPAKEKSINSSHSIEFGTSNSRGKHFVNFNLAKENAVFSKRELSIDDAIISCKERINITTFSCDFSHIKQGDLSTGRYFFPVITSKNNVNIENPKINFLPHFLEFRGIYKKQINDKNGNHYFLIYIEIEVI